MRLTKKKALELYRQMWSDMRDKLGDNPSWDERWEFKRDWVTEHFPSETVKHNCFLCEYAVNRDGHCTDVSTAVCDAYCPLKWTADGYCNTCEGKDALIDGYDWRYSSISDMLTLPEKECRKITLPEK